MAAMTVVFALSSCSSGPTVPDQAALESAASARLQAIPPPAPDKYRNMTDMRNWRNPYLVIFPEEVGLLDPANNEQHLLKTGEVLGALAALPASAWPYGRVVLMESPITGTEEQRIALRRTRGIVAGTLEGAHVLINWIPSA